MTLRNFGALRLLFVEKNTQTLVFTTKVFLLGNTGISLICEEQVLLAGQIKLAGHQNSTFFCVLI